jgi:hypothetical protein
MLYEPEQMYETACDLSMSYFGKQLPEWRLLTWPEKDEWQRRADELNEARESDRA